MLNVAQVASLHRDGQQAHATEPVATEPGAALRAAQSALPQPPALPWARAGPLALPLAPVAPLARASTPPCASPRASSLLPPVCSPERRALPAQLPASARPSSRQALCASHALPVPGQEIPAPNSVE